MCYALLLLHGERLKFRLTRHVYWIGPVPATFPSRRSAAAPPRALNDECFGVFLSGQRCSRQGRAEEASVPAKQSSDGGADLLFMLARHSQARRPVNDAVRLFSSTLTGWG